MDATISDRVATSHASLETTIGFECCVDLREIFGDCLLNNCECVVIWRNEVLVGMVSVVRYLLFSGTRCYALVGVDCRKALSGNGPVPRF